MATGINSISIAPAAFPLPAVDITIRPGVMDDLPFIDSLQKAHTKQVGWMPGKQLEGKIGAGQVLVAEERHEGTQARRHEGEDRCAPAARRQPSVPMCLRASVPVGYCIGHDQYFKRDDVGIIYQLNVVPGRRRALVGATLIKAMFDRAAWGCKLFCCWCAQDIEANRFWESLGFVPLAFRAGSREKGRVHIFWQRRIRAGDCQTPYWFPSQTTGGSIREDRIVLPIPPGTHWSDAKPVVLPSEVSLRL
jgi:GNAT superfamily N-acetyltransferase